MVDKSWAGLHQTPGVLFRNRMHARSFSVELFSVNASQLLTFLQSNADPKEMMAGFQDLYSSHDVMREAARRLHNFLAASMTLVDHTRVLIAENYIHTPIEKQFKRGIEANFASNPMTRFIQDLRNYMVHCGMPPLSRAAKFTPIAGGEPGVMNGLVDWNLETAKLLEWKGWKSEAKKYLKSAPKEIDLVSLANAYRAAILDFHDRLDNLLNKHHEIDVAEAQVYEAELRTRFPG